MAELQDSWRGGGTGRGAYTLTPVATSQVPLTLDLLAGHTANGFLVRNSSGTTLFGVDASGNLTIAGSVSAVISETITGNVAITGTLSATGASTLTGAVTMGTSLSVTGTGYFTGTVTANYNLNVNNNFTVANQSYFLSSVYASRTVYILEQASNPAAVTDHGGIFTKEVSAITELHYIDSSGNVLQITSGGGLGTATNITVADTTDTTCFVGLWESATGAQAPKSDGGLTYNASTAALTATTFVGALTGNVTGNCTGTAATVTGATQASITTCSALTTVGTLVAGNVDAAVSASSLTVAGKVELATTAEINTGTDTTRAMPVDQYVASNRNVRYFFYRAVDNATDTAIATTKGGDFELPYTGTITEIGAYVDTAGTTGTMTVDVNLNGTTLMTTNKITIDTTEKSSRTAATAPGLTTTAVTAGDLITIDIDAIHTTAAKGLTVRLGIRMT